MAHPARVYNYLLGGKDNFAADRKAAEQMIVGGAKLNEELRTTHQTIRPVVQIAGFFGGLEMVEPVLVQLPQWRPDRGNADPGGNITLSAYCGIGRKPAPVPSA